MFINACVVLIATMGRLLARSIQKPSGRGYQFANHGTPSLYVCMQTEASSIQFRLFLKYRASMRCFLRSCQRWVGKESMNVMNYVPQEHINVHRVMWGVIISQHGYTEYSRPSHRLRAIYTCLRPSRHCTECAPPCCAKRVGRQWCRKNASGANMHKNNVTLLLNRLLKYRVRNCEHRTRLPVLFHSCTARLFQDIASVSLGEFQCLMQEVAQSSNM